MSPSKNTPQRRPGVLAALIVTCWATLACSDTAPSSSADSTPLPVAAAESSDSTSIDARVRSELIAAREAVWRAYFSGDSARLVELLPERMVAMEQHREGIIRDALAFVRDGGQFVGITFSEDEFFVRGDVALVFSRYTVDLTQRGKSAPMAGRAIELFEKREGRWINPSWHLDDDRSHERSEDRQ